MIHFTYFKITKTYTYTYIFFYLDPEICYKFKKIFTSYGIIITFLNFNKIKVLVPDNYLYVYEFDQVHYRVQ